MHKIFVLSILRTSSPVLRDAAFQIGAGALLSACFPTKLFPLRKFVGDNASCHRIRLQTLPGIYLFLYLLSSFLSFLMPNSHLSRALSCSATCYLFPFRPFRVKSIFSLFSFFSRNYMSEEYCVLLSS